MSNEIRDNTRRVAFRVIQQYEKAKRDGRHEVAQVLAYCLRGSAYNCAPSYAEDRPNMPRSNMRKLFDGIERSEGR